MIIMEPVESQHAEIRIEHKIHDIDNESQRNDNNHHYL